MKSARTVPLLILALLAVASPLVAQQRMERLFYYVDREDSFESLKRNIDQITIVAPGAFSVDEDGVVWGDLDRRVLDLAKRNGVGVMPLIVNPGFDQEMLHALLVDDEARRRAVESMLEMCRRYELLGIQFDFENLSMNDRDAFTHFYREAAEALHREGYKISIAVVHRPDTYAGPTRYHQWLFKNWRAGYDLAALAEVGDFISIMSYSQHTRRTPPGPQAGLPWTEDVVRYFLEFVPPEKLSMGIPVEAQHWYTSQEDRITPELARSYSRQLSHGAAMGVIERFSAPVLWSDEHQVPYTFFSNGGTFEWIFFENARSFEAKLGLVEKYGLRGFSVWVIGPEDPGIWEVLRKRRIAAR